MIERKTARALNIGVGCFFADKYQLVIHSNILAPSKIQVFEGLIVPLSSVATF